MPLAWMAPGDADRRRVRDWVAVLAESWMRALADLLGEQIA